MESFNQLVEWVQVRFSLAWFQGISAGFFWALSALLALKDLVIAWPWMVWVFGAWVGPQRLFSWIYWMWAPREFLSAVFTWREPEIADHPSLIRSAADNAIFLYAIVVTVALVLVIIKPRKVQRMCEHGFMVEKAVAGSEPINGPKPSFQGEVYVVKDGVETRMGVFFRVDDHLYMPEHVILAADKVYLHYNGRKLEMLEKPRQVDLDLVRVSYAPFCTMEMGAGKFVKRSVPSFVQVHNGDKMTYGQLRRTTTVGYVEYTGTTLPGFSGAPYYAGRVIMGVHLGTVSYTH